MQRNAIAVLASLSAALGMEAITMKLHKEDPLTTHAYPGKNVHKPELIQEVQALMSARHTEGNVTVPQTATSVIA